MHLVKADVTFPNQGSRKHYLNGNKINMSNNNRTFWFSSHLTVGQCVCVCLYFVFGFLEKFFCFLRTLCKYIVVGGFNICCKPSFHLSLKTMKKTMLFMIKSGDIDDADYTCPS